MKTFTALIGSLTLLAAAAVHADDDAAALGKHPNGVIGETELEQEYGKYVYKVELRDGQGKQWDVDLDASSGAVLSDLEDN